MLGLICVSALAELVAVAPASFQTLPIPDRQLLVGKYHFEEGREAGAAHAVLESDPIAGCQLGACGRATSASCLVARLAPA